MTTTTVFTIIGCHRQDPETLLLQGDDGYRYVWLSPFSEPALIEDDPSVTDWSLDGRDDGDADPFGPDDRPV